MKLTESQRNQITRYKIQIQECRKFIEKLKDTNGEMHINVGKGVLLLHEIRLNEPEKGRTNITKLLDENIKENKLKENKLEEIEKSEI